ncbi:MAG: SMC family ATPase [Lachnospiraceae bacterium]|nr:SMC family ATPase [Lachnospiraceae bacterium]
MRPIKVEFQAFGPYVDHQVVDFETIAKKGLFLICGDTGSGKTTILDAITFALFGRSSGSGRDNFEAMRCNQAPFEEDTFVAFEFENGGKYYRFGRKLKRNRKKLEPSYHCEWKEADGEWQVFFENAKKDEMTKKAVELIGLDYEQFRQVIVLPQGQFEKFLVSDSNEKEKILSNIFGEERWKEIAERLYNEADQRVTILKNVKDGIRKSLADENVASLDGLESLIKEHRDKLEAMEKEYREADPHKEIEQQDKQLLLVGRFKELHRTVASVESLLQQKAARDAWEVRAKDAGRAEKIRALLADVKNAEQECARREKTEIDLKRLAEIKRTEAENTAKKLADHVKKQKLIEEKKQQVTQYEGKREAYESLDAAGRKLQQKKQAASAAEKAEEEAGQACEKMIPVIAAVQKAYEDSSAEHDACLKRYLADITGILASELKEHMPCPVCGSTEHPKKAHLEVQGNITKEMVDRKKEESDNKYKKLQESLKHQDAAKEKLRIQHDACMKAQAEAAAAKAELDHLEQNKVSGIETLSQLNGKIAALNTEVEEYRRNKETLEDLEKKAREALTEANARIESAGKEIENAREKRKTAEEKLALGLQANGFAAAESAKDCLMEADELQALLQKIADHDAQLNEAKKRQEELQAELDGKTEPDEAACSEAKARAMKMIENYKENKGRLDNVIERLQTKHAELTKKEEGLSDKLIEAEHDLTLAKRIRGDSGTGLQRYVLGIMFDTVVQEANRMLRLLLDGRYTLFRSDERAVQGKRKKGLDLKVIDAYKDDDTEGRFVHSLSGGEKFLVSLALSIGISMIAKNSGIRIEALFIDEGFGSLDKESIDDAMEVLDKVQEANGIVGIISHVEILQDHIPNKLCITGRRGGSHIEQVIG